MNILYLFLSIVLEVISLHAAHNHKRDLVIKHLVDFKQHKPSVRSLLAYASHAHRFALTDERENCIHIYQNNDRTHLELLRTHELNPYIITALGMSADGQTLAAGLHNNALLFLDTEHIDHQDYLKGHTLHANVIAFNPCHSECASASNDGTINIYHKEKNWHLRQILQNHAYGVHALAYSPDGRCLATGADNGKIIIYKKNGCIVWDIIQELDHHTQWINTLTFNQYSDTLLSGGGDRKITVWWQCNNTWEPIQVIEDSSIISSLAYISPDYFIRGGYDKKMKLYKRKDKQRWQNILESNVHKNWIEHLIYWQKYNILINVCTDGAGHIWHIDEKFDASYDNQEHAYHTKDNNNV